MKARLVALGYLCAVFTLALVVGAVSVSFAQQPAVQAPATAPAVPTMTADEQVMVAALGSLQTIANQACQALDATRHYQAALQRTIVAVERNHPGLTLNAQTGALMPKPPAPKPPQ